MVQDCSKWKRQWLRGMAEALPVMAGFVPFALVLGAQAVQKGFSLAEVPLMTGCNFGGGSEFAALSLWSSPPDMLLVVAVATLVNSRHILMGAAFAPLLRNMPARSAFCALFFMCDESWAMGLAEARRRRSTVLNMPYYFGAAMGMYATWVAFTALGAAIAPSVGDLEQYGFGMAFTAVILVILRGMWRCFHASRPWMVSLAVATAVYVLVPGAWYVPAGALAGLAAAFFWSAHA